MELTARQRHLVSKYTRLVYWVVLFRLRSRLRAWQSKLGLDRDELARIGMVGWCRAGKTWKSEVGVTFKTYAATCIYREIMDRIGDYRIIHIPKYLTDGREWQTRFAKERLADVMVASGTVSDLKLPGLLSREKSPDENAMNEEQQESVRRMVNQLSEPSRSVLWCRFGFDGERLSYENAAKVLHLHKDRVREVERRALQTLRGRMESEPCESSLNVV